MKSTRFRLAASVVILAIAACESSPFEPQGLGERVPLNQKITDEVGGDTVALYSFVGEDSALYAVFFEALQGSAFLFVSDSTHPSRAFGLSGGPGAPPFSRNVTPIFGSGAGSVFNIRVSAVPSTGHTRFSFLVYPIDRRPERHAARFDIGDTVAGETIDPIVDIDEFVVHGEAGQEIVAVGETQGPAGSGSVALNVIDPVTPTLLGYVFADAGTPTLTTNRIRFPATREYQFFFGSVTSNVYPRYSGPYRFWTYLINRAPEHVARTAPFNSEIRSERLDRAGDVDEFTFSAAANSDFNAFLQSSQPCQLEIAPPTDGAYTVVAPNDTALFAHGTGRFHVAQAGTYTIRFSGTENRIADTGSYRWYLYAIDPRPEHVPAAITPSDTVAGESIDRPGDVDDFTFAGTAGQEYNAFLQGQNGSSATTLQLSVIDPAGTVQRMAQSTGADTTLLDQVTGRFSLPTSGTYRLRVSGYGSRDNQDVGPYRVLLYHVDRRPEHSPAQLALGDSLSEAIDAPGDVDEYQVVVPDSSGVNLAAQFDADVPLGTLITVQLLNSSGTVIAAVNGSTTASGSGTLTLPPGTYTVRVDNTHYQDKPTYRAGYRLWLYHIAFAPEAVPDTFAIGDTVSGEVIDPWGDVDRFHFYGLRGQHVNIALQGLAAPGGTLQAWITGPPNAPEEMFAAVSSGTAAAALHDHQTRRMDLTATGWYHVTMSGPEGAGSRADRGAYRFAVESLGVIPEQAASNLNPGDSVTNESIDSPGDWDEFTVTAAPGAEVYATFRGSPFMSIRDGTTGDNLAGLNGWAYDKVLGPVRVPAGGQLIIAAYQPASFVRFCYDATCGGAVPFVGPYSLRVFALNRDPEAVPVAFTMGDTVRGEAVSPIGDIDEFTGSGLPGDTLNVWWRLTADPTPTNGVIWMDVLDAATGVTIGGGYGLIRASQVFYQLGPIVVPAGGEYKVRVQAYGSFGDNTATGPYEFFVKRGP